MMMKYPLLVLFLLSSSILATGSFAQKAKSKSVVSVQTPVKRVDTLTIGGFRPGDQLASFQRAYFKLDTVFWQGRMGANMVKGIITQFGHKGEWRITTREGEIQQVAFNITFADSAKAREVFNRLDREFCEAYGDANERYHNVQQMIKWAGDKRVLSLKGMDGAATLSITLTPVAKPAAIPMPPPIRQN